MKNKTGVILLTTIVTLLCGYYLFLTWVARGVEQKADTYAMDSSNIVSHVRKQHYLDSVWREPVFYALGIPYTYEELKSTELSLGLDLKGGMHVVLEVSPAALVKSIARNGDEAALLKALSHAEAVNQAGGDFLDAFYEAFQHEAPEQTLASRFAHVNTRGRIDPQNSDSEVLEVLRNEIESAIDRSFYILRARLDKFGASQPNIQRLAGTNRIQIELPGVNNPERIRKLLQGVAELSFWGVVPAQQLYPILSRLNDAYVKLEDIQPPTLSAAQDPSTNTEPKDLATLLSADTSAQSAQSAQTSAPSDTSSATDSTSESSVANTSPLFSLLRANDRLLYAVSDTAKVNRMLYHPDLQAFMSNRVRFLWGIQPLEGADEAESYLELYPIASNRSQKPLLKGDLITDARQEFDQYGRPAISMQMNANGAKTWRKMTKSMLNERVAIVMDGRVYSAPVVESEIANGSSQITGNFSLDEAKDLANILKSGSLPAPTRIIEDVVIGPTLAKHAQRQGIISILIALAIVVLFMMMYYARSGLIADLALGFNIFFILGVLTQLNAALTLSGIAGIVLTIGMSIDANVLIFERIREELSAGEKLKTAIQRGYARAYSSIVDANVTTFLTAAILYLLGQGPIKGFAITLMIGIVCSFFTAVFLTRLLMEWIFSKKDSGATAFQSRISSYFSTSINLSIIANRRKAYFGSAILILLGVVAFFAKGGLNLGVDFLGGRAYVVTFDEPPLPAKIEVGLAPYFDHKGVEVKTYGASNVLKITTSYLISEEKEQADQQVKSKLIEGLGTLVGQQDGRANNPPFYISSSVKVGATIAKDIQKAAAGSGVLALLVIFLYIFVRFRGWQFGVGALIALFHDVLVVLSIFMIANVFGFAFEVDQVFVAAMLTLIGYSINDTVIIFDRVRENLHLRPKSPLDQTFNLALNSTFNRTLITSLTTLFVVLVLLFFGGEVLRSFSFALVVGVLTGTYSSLFIASASVVDLLERKKDRIDSK